MTAIPLSIWFRCSWPAIALLTMVASLSVCAQTSTPTPEPKPSVTPATTPGSNHASAPAKAQTAAPQTRDKMWQGGKSVSSIIKELGRRPLNGGSMEILSDTEGVDFRSYLKELRANVQNRWESLVPASALPPLKKSGQVTIKFTILKDGSVRGMELEQSSGDAELDKAAWDAITKSSPFQGLPAAYSKDSFRLRCNFLYNLGTDDKAKTASPQQPAEKK